MPRHLLLRYGVRSSDDRVHEAGSHYSCLAHPFSPPIHLPWLSNLILLSLSQEVEANYNIEHGYKYDAKVIYGDTDSVMVKFGCPDLETAMALGKLHTFIPTWSSCNPHSFELPSFVGLSSFHRRRSGRPRINQIRQAHQARVRESLFPLSPHQQEAIRWALLDEAG
jgi:DNA polymerase elongation subunit (family B)